jgi:predicted acylesterase/phospholipase RssA
MKGGITSGVVYPSALHAIGSTYRIRGIGGASAGAIGAAAGAAAEFGRDSGGYERLRAVAGQLGDGRLADLFQPQPSTKPLLSLMLAVNGADRPGPPRTGVRLVLAVLVALLKAFPVANVIGALPGSGLAAVGAASGGPAGWLLFAAGLVLAAVGVTVAVILRLVDKLTVAVPENMFGICRGRGSAGDEAGGFTDWLCDKIDDIAGLPVTGPPLTFGQLWAGGTDSVPDTERHVDLRMITTCVSEGRPYELPWDARHFFFDPVEWRTLFPERVVAALETAPRPEAPDPEATDLWCWEEEVAAAHNPRLRRLPDARNLPVIVATRLSLSFPLLIAAVPLWTVDRHHEATQAAMTQYRAAVEAGTTPPLAQLKFGRLWFSDGGFCSNFPVHLFDSALPTRPTFAINLGRFPAGKEPVADERENLEWTRTNQAVRPSLVDIPRSGLGAVVGFVSAALNTSRNWQDSSHLDHPGYRDRIVRVLQTKVEGGINLHMDTATIARLAARGQAAAEVMVEQFNEPRYPEKSPVATGWDNHRWVRYRGLLAVLPDWIESYAQGRRALEIDPMSPPSYRLNARERALASGMTDGLDKLAEVVESADTADVTSLTSRPRPQGTLRRTPRT